MLKINNRHTIERVHGNNDNYDNSSRKHIEELLSHFINLRNVMEYNNSYYTRQVRKHSQRIPEMVALGTAS